MSARKRRTQQQLVDMAQAHSKAGTPAHVEIDNEDGIAVLVVDGRETGHYAALCAFDKGASA